jgi:hypothetical protein
MYLSSLCQEEGIVFKEVKEEIDALDALYDILDQNSD